MRYLFLYFTMILLAIAVNGYSQVEMRGTITSSRNDTVYPLLLFLY